MSHLGLSDCWGKTSTAVDGLFTASGKGYMERDLGDGFSVMRVTSGSKLYKKTVDCIASGECGSTTTAPDPLIDWVYTKRSEGICEPLVADSSSHRREWFQFFAAFLVDFGIKRGGTYALVNKASGDVVSATVTAPPRTVHNVTHTCYQGDLRKAGMKMAIEVLTNPSMTALGTWQHHTQGKLGLGNNFLEIVVFATAPEWQGRGCGSMLLRFLGLLADTDGVISLLETAGSRNTTFYSKKGNFEEYSRDSIKSFVHEGGGVAMLRHPTSK